MALLRRRDDKIDVLAGVPLFAGLSRKELGHIARLVTEVEYPPHDYLTYEGQTGREAMVILAGRCTVRRNGRKVAEVSVGDVVGEMSLVTNRRRNASVRADTVVTALVMNTREFSSLVDEHPQVGAKILRTVADRLAEATRAD
jgi:CRP-like cAMP-binding protein